MDRAALAGGYLNSGQWKVFRVEPRVRPVVMRYGRSPCLYLIYLCRVCAKDNKPQNSAFGAETGCFLSQMSLDWISIRIKGAASTWVWIALSQSIFIAMRIGVHPRLYFVGALHGLPGKLPVLTCFFLLRISSFFNHHCKRKPRPAQHMLTYIINTVSS